MRFLRGKRSTVAGIYPLHKDASERVAAAIDDEIRGTKMGREGSWRKKKRERSQEKRQKERYAK